MSETDIVVVDNADPRAIADIYRVGKRFDADSWVNGAVAMARQKHGR